MPDDHIEHEYPWGASGPLVVSRLSAPHTTALLATQWPGLFTSAGFKPKETFSPSAIETADGCESAWGYRYLWGVKEPEVTYEQVLAGLGADKDRARAFGKGLHYDAESYYRTGQFDVVTDHGKAFHAGTHLIPTPGDGAMFEIELGLTALDTRKISAGIEPIHFVGYKDLVFYRDPESPVLYDWKSTSDFKWAKTPDVLRADLAANLYGLDVMMASGRDTLIARWVYFRSRGAAAAIGVDFVLDFSAASGVVNEALITAARLRAYIRDGASPEDLDKNPEHCPKFAAKRGTMGCPYHRLNGGPCNVSASPTEQVPFNFAGALISADRLLRPTTETSTEKGVTNNTMTIQEYTAAHPQQPGETLVSWKVRIAKEFNAAFGMGQPGAAPQGAPQGFAPPPPGFLTPPAAAAPPPAPAPVYAPPPQVAPPVAPPVYPPVASHVLPPEASAPQTPPGPPAPPPPQAPPQAYLPTAPAAPTAPPQEAPKRRGRPAKAAPAAPAPAAPGIVSAPAEQSQGVIESEVLESTLTLDGLTVVITGENAEEVRAVAGMVRGLFA